MKVKLKKDLVDKLAFGMGGDMNEDLFLATNHKGEPISYAQFLVSGGRVMSLHCLDKEKDFLVVDHARPMSTFQYQAFQEFYEEANEE